MELKSENVLNVDQKGGNSELSESELKTLYSFFVSGNAGEDFTLLAERKLTTIHDAVLTDDQKNLFPICLLESDSQRIAVSLNEMFEMLAQTGEQMAEGSKQVIMDLKKHVKSHLNGYSEELLYKIWEKSAHSLLESFNDDKEKVDEINKIIELTKKKLSLKGKVVALKGDAAPIYLETIINRTWKEKSNSFAKELDLTINRLNGLLESDILKSKKGKSADNLKSTVGDVYKDTVDFGKLSTLLDNSIKENILSDSRKKRIKTIIKNLVSSKSFYLNDKGNENPLLTFQSGFKSINAIEQALKKYQIEIIDFFKAVHMARLEINSKYDESKHNTYFKNFNLSLIGSGEIKNIPPITILIREPELDDFNYRKLADLVDTELPVKILLLTDEVTDFKKTQENEIKTKNITRKLVSLAIDIQKCFVLQSTLDKLPELEDNLKYGLDYNGPALFCINYLNAKNYNYKDELSAYSLLHSSRAFPTFCYTPDPGLKISYRFNISSNPSTDQDWFNNGMRIIHKGTESLSEIPVTYLDFIAQDKRLNNHLVSISFEKFHSNLIPVHEYLSMTDEEVRQKLPYLLMHDNKGTLSKVIPDFNLLKSAYNILDDWHTLQEITAVSDQGPSEVSSAEQEEISTSQPVKSTQEIQRETISNILNRLISGDLEGKTAAKESDAEVTESPVSENPPQEQSDTAPEQETPQSTNAEEISDPYIDTALCTSCGDCLNINNMMFAYDENKQAFIKDATKGTFKQLVMAAEKCPAFIIHPGKPKDPNEKDLEKLIKRAEKFN